jgi:TrmH family RNA methyltransferase
MQIGRHSPKLAQLRKAIRQGTLTADGLLPIEGPILLEEAHRSQLEVADVFVRNGTTVPAVAPNHVHEVPPDVFKTIQETEHSQGVIATVKPRQFNLSDVLNGSPALIVVLGRLQDPGNVGTILRIAEAFGATGCVALRGTASFYNTKVVRASAGSVFRLPHVGGADLRELAAALRSKKIRIVGTAPTSESSIEKWDWRNPTAVLVGNEGSGLNAEELEYCDTVLRISHQPAVESLNSAIASAVILYEASKQRRGHE